MKRIFLLTFLLGLTICSFGQDKKDLVISFTGGILNSPYFDKAKPAGYYGFDMEYFVAPRQILAASYFGGKHYYYDDELSNSPMVNLHADETNSRADYRVFSVLYKYKVLNASRLGIAIGAGLGLMTLVRRYPYHAENWSSMLQAAFTDPAFPVEVDVAYSLAQHWLIGLAGGFLIEPDYPVLALHAGLRFSYVFR